MIQDLHQEARCQETRKSNVGEVVVSRSGRLPRHFYTWRTASNGEAVAQKYHS